MNQEKRPVTVEDLLRLKRVERPPAEFWSEFDRELRAKQLAALVARPWWQTVPQAIFGRLGQLRLPLGAAAALAVTFITVRESSPRYRLEENMHPEAVVTNSSWIAPVVAAPIAETYALAEEREEVIAPVAAVAVDDVAPVASESVSVASVETPVASVNPPAASVAVDTPAPGHLTRMISLMDSVELPPRYVSASLAAAQEVEALATASLLRATVAQGFESRALPDRTVAVDPLQQMPAPSESRNARILNAMVPSIGNDISDRAARVARQLSDAELYEQVRRFEARSGGISLRL